MCVYHWRPRSSNNRRKRKIRGRGGGVVATLCVLPTLTHRMAENDRRYEVVRHPGCPAIADVCAEQSIGESPTGGDGHGSELDATAHVAITCDFGFESECVGRDGGGGGGGVKRRRRFCELDD